MYSSNLEIDTGSYPELCPGCGAARWQDRDWETGLIYCSHCGWYAGEDDANSVEEGGAHGRRDGDELPL